LLYFFIYLQSFAEIPLVKGLCWLLAFIIFSYGLMKSYYFLAFTGGFAFSQIIPPPRKVESGHNFLCRSLFRIQGYGYDFFLIHGGILVLLAVILKLSIKETLMIGVLVSILSTLLLHKISGSILKRIL
jgi:hypothetical protein